MFEGPFSHDAGHYVFSDHVQCFTKFTGAPLDIQRLNPYPVAKMSSAICLVCYKFRGTSTSFKVGETNDQVSYSLDPGEIRIKTVCIWDYGRDQQEEG